MAIHGLMTLPFALALSGVVLAWFFYMKRPDIPAAFRNALLPSTGYWKTSTVSIALMIASLRPVPVLSVASLADSDVKLIDGALVNGTAHLIGKLSGVVRKLHLALFIITHSP